MIPGRRFSLQPTVSEINPHGEATRYTRGNYWVFVLEGGLFLSGVAFVSLDSVLPVIAKSLGGPDWLIAFMPMLMMIGFMLPPFFTAHWLENMGRLLPTLRFFGLLQRLPYLFAAIALFTLGDTMPVLALIAVAACPLLSGIFGGITIAGWMRLTSRTVRSTQRSSASAIRNMIGAAVGIAAGLLTETILSSLPGTNGFALLHAITFGLLFMSFGIFCLTDEPDTLPPPNDKRRTFRQQIRSLLPTLKADPGFRTYVLSRASGCMVYITVPFMAIHAQEVTASPAAFVGQLLAWQMAGNMAGNVIGGFLGDKIGSRTVLLSMRCIAFSMAVLFFFSESALLFSLSFAFWGICHAMQIIGEQTFMAEYTMGPRMPTYMAINAVSTLSAMLLAALLSSLTRAFTHDVLPLVLLTGAGLATSVFLLAFKVPEPRRGQTATAHNL